MAIVKARKHEIPYLEDTFYVEQALSPGATGGSAIRPTVLTADELPGEPLSQYRVVFCVNLPAPGDEAAERLRRYVADGGNLVWIAGDNVDPEAYNQHERGGPREAAARRAGGRPRGRRRQRAG